MQRGTRSEEKGGGPQIYSCFLGNVGPQVEAQKSTSSSKIDFKSRLEQRVDRRSLKSFEKRRHTRVQEPIFEANAVQHAYHACALGPNIYRSAWPSAVYCGVATWKPQESVAEASWGTKMTSNLAPYGPQESFQTSTTSIFSVLEVDSKTKLRKRRQPNLSREIRGGLALWEEGREVGKPTTHAVYS